MWLAPSCWALHAGRCQVRSADGLCAGGASAEEKCCCLLQTAAESCVKFHTAQSYTLRVFCVGFECLLFVSVQQGVFEIGLGLEITMFVIFHCQRVS